MNEEEYLDKLIEDFGELNEYSNEEKIEFSNVLKKLTSIMDKEDSFEEIIAIILEK